MDTLPSKKALLRHIDAFPRAQIMVVGDLMVDHFICGTVERISPEAPVPVVSITSESICLGGAANVAHNIHALGGGVCVAGVAGNDEMGERIIRELRSLRMRTRGIVVAKDRPTTIKTRIIAHSQQVVRFDRERIGPLDPESSRRMEDRLRKDFSKIDAVLVSDYGKGTISRELMATVVRLGKRAGKPIIVDPKVKNMEHYQGVSMITPNQHEAGETLRMKVLTDEDAARAAVLLKERVGCESVLITRGEEGMTLLEKDGSVAHIPTLATEVYDVTGAGDTVASVFTLAITVGASPKISALLANYAAGIVIKKVGTACVTREELKKAILAQNYILNETRE